MRSDELYDLLYQERCIGNIKDKQEKKTAELCLRDNVDMFFESSFCRKCTPEEFELWRDENINKRSTEYIIRKRALRRGLKHV